MSKIVSFETTLIDGLRTNEKLQGEPLTVHISVIPVFQSTICGQTKW